MTDITLYAYYTAPSLRLGLLHFVGQIESETWTWTERIDLMS